MMNFLKKHMPWLRDYYHRFLIRKHKRLYKKNKGNLRNYFEKKYFKVFNSELNIDNPKKLTEYIYQKMYNEPNELECLLTDKIKAKEYLKEKGFQEYIVKTLKVFNSCDEISFEGLPDKFVIKSNNDSGSVFIVDQTNDEIIDKNHHKISYKRMIKHLKSCFKNEFWLLNFEKQYKSITPLIFAEEFLDSGDLDENFIIDYKYFCHNGRPLFADIIFSREGGIDHDFYVDTNFSQIFANPNEKVSSSVIESCRPSNLKEMLEFIESISKDIEFVRIDLYCSKKFGIKFGEFTFSPAGGNGEREYPVKEHDFAAGKMLGL